MTRTKNGTSTRTGHEHTHRARARTGHTRVPAHLRGQDEQSRGLSAPPGEPAPNGALFRHLSVQDPIPASRGSPSSSWNARGWGCVFPLPLPRRPCGRRCWRSEVRGGTGPARASGRAVQGTHAAGPDTGLTRPASGTRKGGLESEVAEAEAPRPLDASSALAPRRGKNVPRIAKCPQWTRSHAVESLG